MEGMRNIQTVVAIDFNFTQRQATSRAGHNFHAGASHCMSTIDCYMIFLFEYIHTFAGCIAPLSTDLNYEFGQSTVPWNHENTDQGRQIYATMTILKGSD